MFSGNNRENQAVSFLEEEGFVFSSKNENRVIFAKNLKRWFLEVSFSRGSTDFLVYVLFVKEKSVCGKINENVFWMDFNFYDKPIKGIEILLKQASLVVEILNRFLEINENLRLQENSEDLIQEETLGVECIPCRSPIFHIHRDKLIFCKSKEEFFLLDMTSLDNKTYSRKYNDFCGCISEPAIQQLWKIKTKRIKQFFS